MRQGFKRLEREATVESGSTTDVNLAMQVGAKTESVTVEGTSPQIRYESHEIDGMVTRPQIEGLPLNGRNFLELAKLEPGAQPPTRDKQQSNPGALAGLPGGPERPRNARYRGRWQRHGGRKWRVCHGILAGSSGGISGLHRQL